MCIQLRPAYGVMQYILAMPYVCRSFLTPSISCIIAMRE